MAKKLFEKAGLINLPSKPAAADQQDASSQDHRPKTAPGAMLQFMGQQSAAVREVEDLRTRLQEFDGARVVRLLEPSRIAPSRWANRHETSFADAEFALLKEEIRSAGGNVQPIKVRPLKPDGVLNGSTPGVWPLARAAASAASISFPMTSLAEISWPLMDSAHAITESLDCTIASFRGLASRYWISDALLKAAITGCGRAAISMAFCTTDTSSPTSRASSLREMLSLESMMCCNCSPSS